MRKKKLTNKELTNAIAELSSNDQMLLQYILEIKQVFSLYLEHTGKTESFNKFVKGKTEEFERQQSKDKKGA